MAQPTRTGPLQIDREDLIHLVGMKNVAIMRQNHFHKAFIFDVGEKYLWVVLADSADSRATGIPISEINSIRYTASVEYELTPAGGSEVLGPE